MASGKESRNSDQRRSAHSSGVPSSATKKNSGENRLAYKQGVYYPSYSPFGYYYPGYDGMYSEWSGQGCSYTGDRMGIPYTVNQSMTNPMVCYMPGYNAYTPATMMGSDGQFLGSQQYLSYSMVPLSSSSHDTTLVAGSSKGPVYCTDFQNGMPTNTKLRDSRCIMPIKSVSSSVPHFEPLNKFSLLPNQEHDLHTQTSLPRFQMKENICVANGRIRNKVNRNNEFDLSRGLTCGPRAYGIKNGEINSSSQALPIIVQRENYNLPDFKTEYEDAMFFIIKSYNEDNVHKSIKYNVWSSTPGGNKKLDIVYHNAQARFDDRETSCPVFLFFSVNGSGQFVGVAEMMDSVDFKKTMHFWHQDKWTGFFPVKWHVIKDIPNSQLCHIILENNENRPVTFSRDTQEIKFHQGLEMLNVFKNYEAETSLLDDFSFYESREKGQLAERSEGHEIPFSELGDNSVSCSEYTDCKFSNTVKRNYTGEDPDTQNLITFAKNLSLGSPPQDERIMDG